MHGRQQSAIHRRWPVFCVTEVEQPGLLLTAESSRSAKLVAYSRGQEDELRMQDALPQCAPSTETVQRYDVNLGRFLSGGWQEPNHRITRCHNRDSESTLPIRQIISTPFDSPIEHACKKELEMICYSTIGVLGHEGEFAYKWSMI